MNSKSTAGTSNAAISNPAPASGASNEDRSGGAISPWPAPVGAMPAPGGVRFRIWAPEAPAVDVIICARPDAPQRAAGGDRHGDESVHRLKAVDGGYHDAVIAEARVGDRYRFRIQGTDYPDPASRFQPDGVHGASEVVDGSAFDWTDAGWKGISMDRLVIYELHVGTFTPEGTFDSAIDRLDHLASLGVTAVEIMPVATFAGSRNWGYDGVQLFAPAAVYGRPDAFRRFVDAAHARGLGVILDVVYNHFGPEGNYLPAITGGKFFTDRHHTPWGDAVNCDGPGSDAVRDFLRQNARYWALDFHIDGLRLDATHAIIDTSERHLLAEITDELHAMTPPRILIAEDERNERRVVSPTRDGGYGLDAVWADDLHHHLRVMAAGDHESYFASYSGSAEDLAATLRAGWFYQGQRSPHRGEPRGTSAAGLPVSAFVHCIQNHDQVGNRAMGDRITESVSLTAYRALSTLLLMSPYTPLLWMGQEWAASTPFQFFTDHPPELGKLVTNGRREEFRQFSAFANPATRDRIPDPQAESTFMASKLRWEESTHVVHAGTLTLYRELLALRGTEPALLDQSRDSFQVEAVGEKAVMLERRSHRGRSLAIIMNLGGTLETEIGAEVELILASEDQRFGGEGVTGRISGTRLTMSAGAVIVSRP